MTATTATSATEVQRIEAALDALVTAAIAHDRDQPITPDPGPVAAGELMMDMLTRLGTWTEAQRRAADLLRRPVAWACRNAIRDLGKRLHEIGGTKLMGEVCDRVSSSDPRQEHRRAGIMDHRWDGIGDWVA